MTRALVLNAGASLAAYQIGALRYLVGERGLHFDMYAGTGIGAMNAAFVACGHLSPLEAFWDRIGVRSLVSINVRTPWRGLASNAPQRRFVAAHLDEQRLAERGATLLVSTLNLQTGHEDVLTYPGCDLPLVDGLMAAVATPGLCPPVPYGDHQLVEGTLVQSILLRTVLDQPIDEIVVVAPALPERSGNRRYRTWRAVGERALAMNQTRDVRDGIAAGERAAAAADAFRTITGTLPERLAARVSDGAMKQTLHDRVAAVYASSPFPLRRESGPRLVVITPSDEVAFPPWSFKRDQLRALRDLGYDDARRVLQEEALS